MNTTKLKLPGLNDYFVQEAFNVLRTNLLFCGQDVKVIAVTSCGMNEGKTLLSLHIARSLSEIHKRVLVIDADLRKSVMAGRNAEVKDVKGLSEVLTGQAELQDCIYATQFENLHVMFSGKFPPNPVELLNGKYFEKNIDVLSDIYDYIIIDTPPLGMVIDAAVVCAKCDSAIMVIDSNRVRYPVAQEVLDQLRKSGCSVLGAVLNHAEQKSRSRNGHKYNNYGSYYYSGKYGGQKYQYTSQSNKSK